MPVVIVSMLDEHGAGFALGAAEYLVKPVERRTLLDALAALRRPAARRRDVVAIDDEPRRSRSRGGGAGAGRLDGRARGRRRGGRRARAPRAARRRAPRPADAGRRRLRGRRAAARGSRLADVPIVVLTSKDMTPADRERLDGQISHLARKGTFRRRELVELVERLAAGTPRVKEAP